MATDPICGMYVDERTAELRLVRENRTYYFCATSCLEQFAAPEEQLQLLRRRLWVAWPFALVAAVLTYLQPFPAWPLAALLAAAVVQFYPGLTFYRGFVDAVKSRIANMDVLIAVGTSVAFGYSTAALLLPGRLPSAYYFDASSLIIALILTGNYLEHLTRGRASNAIRRLQDALPTRAHVWRGGRAVDVPVSEVAGGELVSIRPGERFPTDGTIRDGRSGVNESLVSGESLPVDKGPGDSVLAGSLNGEGVLTVYTTKVGEDTFLAGIGHLLDEAETSRVPLQRLADRIAERFVPLVLAIAVVAAIGWSLAGAGLTIALLAFVSVAITACPCAFGIATPAAITVGTGRAAEAGIMFRGSDALENAAKVNRVVLDKTGTLTLGQPELTDILTSPAMDDSRLLAITAGLEAASEHPLAQAVRRAAQVKNVPPATLTGVMAVPGWGLRGQWEGRSVEILRGEDPASPAVAPLNSGAALLDDSGKTWSIVRLDGMTVGLLGFFDAIRPEVPEAVARLNSLGVRVAMVTGDRPRAAAFVARQAGISDIRAGVSPEGKLEIIREFQLRGETVAFVGDGINDAPALAAADLGMAIGTGTEVAKEAGRVILVRPDVRGVPFALEVGRRTVAKVRQNLFWAIGYNAVLLPVAVGALVPVFGLAVFSVLPLTGALAMGLSSTSVVLNSLSLRRMDLGYTGVARSPQPTQPRAGFVSTT